MDSILQILYIPFGWILSVLYNFVGDYGLALVLFTVFFKLILVPSSISQQKGTAKQARLQPKIKKIQEKYKGNQVKMNEEMQALYSREGYNPMSAGCMPMLIQMPIIFGLYGVIYRPLTYVLRFSKETVAGLTGAAQALVTSTLGEAAAKQAANHMEIQVFKDLDHIIAAVPGLTTEVVESLREFAVDFQMFGISMADIPNMAGMKENHILIWIPVLSFLSSMLSAVYMYMKQRKQNPEMAKNPMMGCMSLGMPLFSLYMTTLFPAGIGMYWILSNILGFIQTLILSNVYSPSKVIAEMMVKETVTRRSREENVKMIAKSQSDEA